MGGVLAFERDSSEKCKTFPIKCLPLLYTDLICQKVDFETIKQIQGISDKSFQDFMKILFITIESFFN